MIIRVDNDRDGYAELFTKAYDLLVEKGVISENEAGRLTSLEEFFSYIQDIVQYDDRYLIRLPVEEPTLTIDANKRTIDTSMFSKCITVQSDQIAEILVFSIDRYYDYKDLADEKVQIWVQWTAPNGTGGTVEGATYISLKDTETERGKLRFGWPLDNVVTAHPGNVQFAVRFFMKDDVEEYDNAGNLTTVNKIVYSLNTLPATLAIKSALQPELNDDIAVNRPNGLFSYAVRNSLYTGKDVALPQTPTFDAPGSQPPIEATLVNNTLTLMAQAVAGDVGTIEYKWYYKKVGASVANEVPNNNYQCTIGTAYRISSAKERVLSDDYYSNPSVTTSSAKDVYYSAIDSTTVKAFNVYAGEVEYQEQADGTFMLVDSNGLPLYEKYTTLTVPPTGEVTGTYTVKAWNTTTVGEVSYQSEPRESRECTLVSPTPINIVEPLPVRMLILKDVDEENNEITVPAALQVVLTTKENDNTNFNYVWSRASTRTGTATEVQNSAANKYNASTPGWYKVYITASLNRQTDETTTDWCKVTEMPAAPKLVINNLDGGTLDEDADSLTLDKAIGTTVTLSVNPSVEDATSYTEEDLYCEKLSYAWTVQVTDGDERPLTKDEIIEGEPSGFAVIGDDGPEAIAIKVASLGDVNKNIVYTYKCTVTNELNNEIAASAVTYRLM